LAVAGRVDILVAGLRVRFQCRIHFELKSRWRCVGSEEGRKRWGGQWKVVVEKSEKRQEVKVDVLRSQADKKLISQYSRSRPQSLKRTNSSGVRQQASGVKERQVPGSAIGAQSKEREIDSPSRH
jgi:CRISPR/Cas system-associated exonuclease Cas4 (RecB family)